MSIRTGTAALALAILSVLLGGCDSAPSTPLPEDTVAVVAGQPITYADFLRAREQVVGGLERMERDIQPGSEPMRVSEGKVLEASLPYVEAIERYGVDAVALAVLMRDQALWAAAVAAGFKVSDEEVAQHIAEQRSGVLIAIESARQEVEGGQSEVGGDSVPSPEETLSDYATAVAQAGGEEALWENAALPAKRYLLVSRFMDAEFDRMYREEVISYEEARLRTERATIAEAEVVITGDPPIDATREEALAYLEWFWERAFATPSR